MSIITFQFMLFQSDCTACPLLFVGFIFILKILSSFFTPLYKLGLYSVQISSCSASQNSAWFFLQRSSYTEMFWVKCNLEFSSLVYIVIFCAMMSFVRIDTLKKMASIYVSLYVCMYVYFSVSLFIYIFLQINRYIFILTCYCQFYRYRNIWIVADRVC